MFDQEVKKCKVEESRQISFMLITKLNIFININMFRYRRKRELCIIIILFCVKNFLFVSSYSGLLLIFFPF